MRKKFAAGGLAVLGALAFGVGGTYAAFSDTEQGPNTLVEAGALDLRLSTQQGASFPSILFENLKPGDERFYFVQLTNDGTIPGNASWAFENTQELENTCGAPEKAAGDPTCGIGKQDGELGDQLAVTFFLMPGPGCTGKPQVVGPPSFPSSADYDEFRSLGGLVLTPGPDARRCVRVDIKFLDDRFNNNLDNNLAQGDSSRFGFRFQLVS